MRGRAWGPADRTGGPLDRVLDEVRRHLPGLIVERLDDENIYFLGDEFGLDRVQIASGPGGTAPFVVENGGSIETADATEAAAVVGAWLGEAP
jgi:hypothetical protein